MLRFLVKRAVASDLWRYKMDGCNYEHCLIHAIGKVRHFQYAVVFICTVVLWMRNINNVLNALCALLSVELEMSVWVQFKLCMTVRRCMQDKAPQYLKEYCISFSDTQSTASSLSQPSPSFCATSSSNFWPSGLRCCWSDGVELSTWRFTVRNVATIILDDS